MTAAPADAAAVEVSDGIYAYLQPDGSWYLNNTGFLTGRHGVISIARLGECRQRGRAAWVSSTRPGRPGVPPFLE